MTMTFYASTAASAQTSPAPARRGMGLVLIAGLGAAVAGAVIWALIGYLTKHQYSLVAIGVGSMVGYTISRVRPGSAAAASAGAVLALLGCALGTFLALIVVAAREGSGLSSVLGHLNVVVHAYPRSVGALGIVFWLMAAALGFAYTLGLRQDRSRPAPPAQPVPPVQDGAGPSSFARPAPGGYGTPQAPSDHDDHGAPDDQPAPGWPPEPAAVAHSGPPSAPMPMVRDIGPPSAPMPMVRDIGPPPSPMPAGPSTGPLSAPLPMIPSMEPPSAPMPRFRDHGPLSAPPPAMPGGGSGPLSAPPPGMPSRGPLSAPPPAMPSRAPFSARPPGVPSAGPPSAPMPAVQPGSGAWPPGRTAARHAAPEPSGPPPSQPPQPPQRQQARDTDDHTAATLPRRQRPRGKHSRPQS